MDQDNMNQNPIESGSQMPPVSTMNRPPEQERSSAGPLAGTIIIIILLIAGGLYFWGAKLNKETNTDVPYIPNDDAMMMKDDGQIIGELQSDTSAGLPPQSASDDVSSIEADFNAMDLDAMEAQNSAELNSI